MDELIDGSADEVLKKISEFADANKTGRTLFLAVMCHGDEADNMVFTGEKFTIMEIKQRLCGNSSLSTRVCNSGENNFQQIVFQLNWENCQ